MMDNMQNRISRNEQDISGLCRMDMKNRFYSEFTSRGLSGPCLEKLAASICTDNLGFISIQISDFYTLTEQHGTETGFQILTLLEEETARYFSLFFRTCDVISLEHVNINHNVICFRMPDAMIPELTDQVLALQAALNDHLSLVFSDIIGGPLDVRAGHAWISRHHEGGFYEAVFKAFCTARRTAALMVSSGSTSLKKQFLEILENDLLRCEYQPVMNLDTGGITGWEAFVRGPDQGYFRQPETLFSYAAEIGKIYMLDRKCREKAIRDMGIICTDQHLFMNVHPESLNDRDFTPGLTRQQTRDYGLRARNIVLEFSENHGNRDYRLILKNLEHYRNQGFKVAIDNFSHTTLDFISQVKPDYIKIDPSLIRGISYYPVKRGIVEGIVVLADKIGAKIVASGVETESEVRTLGALGVRLVQGYYIARPEFPKSTRCGEMPSEMTTGSGRRGQRQTTVRELVRPAVEVAPDAIVADVKDMLKFRDPFCGVVVTENKKLKGLLMSYHLNRRLGTQYGIPLFFHRKVSILMDPDPLVAEAGQLLGEVARAAMNREPAKIYDDVIVVENEIVIGVLSVQQMLETLAKAEIRAREDAEAASRGKSAFLAGMSHDIRTPMTSILGMADLLRDTPLNPEQEKYVRIFRNAGENLLELINDILDLSKAEAGQITLEQVEFNLEELVANACEVMAYRVHEKNMELIFYVEPDIPRYVTGDPARLRQIIFNLVANAVKFTQTGEIAVWVERIPDTENADGFSLRFSVRDTGIGIPGDKLETIFEDFTQAHVSTNREYGGTGLGLAICKRLTGLMDGRIWVESEVGVGSTFYFTARFAPAPFAALVSPELHLDGVSVLVADDNPTSRYMLGKSLSQWGATVEMAGSGEACLEALALKTPGDRGFDLVLLDSRMPGMDGFVTAGHIREHHENLRIVMMLVSGEMGRAGGSEMDAAITKPVSRKDLMSSVCKALGRVPSESCQENAAPCEKKQCDSLPPLRILLAEDNENNRMLFSFYLQNSPHQLDTAENGKTCFEKYISGSYDMIFMDVDMPVMDGYQAADAIRRWERENKRDPVPVVALTAHAFREKRQESLDAGCTDHMIKPFKKDEIFRMMTTYACSRTEESATVPESAPEESSQTDNAGQVQILKELEPLIPGFMENTRRDIEELEAAINAQDYEQTQRLGHRIRGAALCYGFEKLGTFGANVEEAAGRNIPFDRISSLCHAMKTHLENIRVVFE